MTEAEQAAMFMHANLYMVALSKCMEAGLHVIIYLFHQYGCEGLDLSIASTHFSCLVWELIGPSKC